MPMTPHPAVGSLASKKAGAKVTESPRPGFRPGQAKNGWIPCDAESSKHSTATGFFFSSILARDVDVPIGLLNITKGNARISSWVSPMKRIILPTYQNI